MLHEPTGKSAPTELFKLGQEQAEAMLNAQNEILRAYEEASHVWLERMKSEVDLWSELATKMTAARSIPDALGAYQKCLVQRMQMAAEDGRRLTDDYQKMMSTITRSIPNGLRAGTT